ncbi:heavy metal-responsive transcriptional regulator [Georgenia subflava]|uniref:MerR family DNA-binding protein n=1 Tax=Georgenia subflava TaxID=1622177 RepID=A0A6N7EL10_9MICO|nr:heavy metal-responsive transcriptional regulator [Georgenia subflava]MPV35954.1 MerR family DNA-binding protein [Georgenia subflava]
MRIGEVAHATGTTTKTLRFYEDVGILPPSDRTPSGYRDYGPEVLGRLNFIHRGQAAGLTLAQIGQILQIRDGGEPPCRHVTDVLTTRLEDIDAQIAQLQELRTAVTRLRDDAVAGNPADCSSADVCRYL